MSRLLVVVPLLLAALMAPGARAAVRADGPARAPLPESFAGLSVETDTVGTWFAARGCSSPAREVLALLGRPQIRVGGNSQDRLWPNGNLPAGQHQVASAPYFHALRCLAAARSPLLVGLNLLGRDPQASGDLLAAVQTVVPPSLLSVALGNEPNLYGGRLPQPRGYPGYLALYGQTMAALRARFGGRLPPVAGPDAATWRWEPETVRFVADVHPQAVDVHLYGLNGCNARPGTPSYPTPARLLSPEASTILVRRLGGVAAAARVAHVPAEISEANSVACRGVSGVSDHPASALWALSVLGEAAIQGFGRIEFHTSNGNYDPFVLRGDGTVAFRPLMTAMVLADRLWPQGTRPLHLRGTLPEGVAGWVARRPDGRLAVLLVDRDQRRGAHVRLATAARGGATGTLRGAGSFAVTLDGQQLTWHDGAPAWRGRSSVQRVRARDGHVTVGLAPQSARWVLLDRAGT